MPRELLALCFVLLEDCTRKNDVIRCLISASIFFIIACSRIWAFLSKRWEDLTIQIWHSISLIKYNANKKNLSGSKFIVLVTLKGDTLFRSGRKCSQVRGRFAVERQVFDVFSVVTRERGRGNSQWRQGILLVPPPQVITKIKKILPWLYVKLKKNSNILPLKRAKFEIFAWVIA